jgi:hypothetical protein
MSRSGGAIDPGDAASQVLADVNMFCFINMLRVQQWFFSTEEDLEL